MTQTKTNSRKPMSKKTRFEVFKRDRFTCQYCGNAPPKVTLEIDHMVAIKNKGTNNINNLITSCFDCNRGKSHILLEKLPNTIRENYDILQEKELQLSEYNKLIKIIERRESKEAESISKIYNSWYTDYVLSDKFKRVSVKQFIRLLGLSDVKDAMDSACSKIKDSDDSIKYFCGICWNKIKNKGRGCGS